jgi:ATP synthase F1 complex assembly factor 2
MQAARVEEEFQIESWGVVEGQHDYDRLNCSVQMHAAVLLCNSLAVDNGWAY